MHIETFLMFVVTRFLLILISDLLRLYFINIHTNIMLSILIPHSCIVYIMCLMKPISHERPREVLEGGGRGGSGVRELGSFVGDKANRFRH